MQPNPADAIFALATPPGRSGVAVLRLSAPDLSTSFAALRLPPLTPRQATLVRLMQADGSLIDRALLLYFPAPHSFTGEDVLEFHLHGSRAVLAELTALLGALPAHRVAEPGEFSRRAFEHGKLDLAEVEGLADLIDAETAAQKRQALRQMEGALSLVASRLRESLMRTLAYLEAFIDFPDEEIPAEAMKVIDAESQEALAEIDRWLASASHGERLREGFYVTILGIPNAGKSTLLNALARRDIAIVSNEAGTTRDLLEVRLDLGGIPVLLADTAGLRQEAGLVELEGIRRALARSETSDIRLILLDPTSPMNAQTEVLKEFQENDILLVGKTDQPPHSVFVAPTRAYLNICPVTGAGLDKLLETLQKRLNATESAVEPPILTRERHRCLFVEGREALVRSTEEAAIELRAEGLRRAIFALSGIMGAVRAEDILDMVFSSFCLGK